MTREQLKTLSTIPQVIQALRAFISETDQLKGLLAQAGLTAPVGGRQPLQTAAAPAGPVVLDTPERREYAQQLANGTASAIPDENLPPHKAARLAYLNQMKQDPIRQEKLAQFKHDDEDLDAEAM